MTLDELRRNFPHTEHTVYLNHAATGPLSRPVVEAVNRYIEQRHYSNIENYADFLPLVEETKQKLGRLLGVGPDRVEFAPNTSYALGFLANGIGWKPSDRVALPACEFPANVYPFMNLHTQGVEVDFIPHQEGTFTIEDVEQALTPQTRLLTLSWVQFLSGFRADLAEIGSLCKQRGVIFCVDAIQGLGALQLDAKALGIDFLASGAWKWLMGPQGIGFVYVSEQLQEQIAPPAGWLHGPIDWDNFFEYKLEFHPDASRFRLGTMNNMGIAGLNAALGLYLDAGPAWCEEHVLARSAQLAAGLEGLGLSRYGSRNPAHASGIVTVQHPAPEALEAHLKKRNITVCLRNRMLRFAPTYYNSPEEIETALDAVAEFGTVQA